MKQRQHLARFKATHDSNLEDMVAGGAWNRDFCVFYSAWGDRFGSSRRSCTLLICIMFTNGSCHIARRSFFTCCGVSLGLKGTKNTCSIAILHASTWIQMTPIRINQWTLGTRYVDVHLYSYWLRCCLAEVLFRFQK